MMTRDTTLEKEYKLIKWTKLFTYFLVFRPFLFQSFCDDWLAQDTDKARFMEKISRHTREVQERPQCFISTLCTKKD